MPKRNIGVKKVGDGEHLEMLSGLLFGLEMVLKVYININ